MISVSNLRSEDRGRWVEYTGGAGEKERGRLKSWNQHFIFVVYKCDGQWNRYSDFTGQATDPSDLRFIKDEK